MCDDGEARFAIEFGDGWKIAPWDPTGCTVYALPETPPPTDQEAARLWSEVDRWTQVGAIDEGWLPQPRETPRWPLVSDRWVLDDGVWRLH